MLPILTHVEKILSQNVAFFSSRNSLEFGGYIWIKVRSNLSLFTVIGVMVV